MCCGLPTKLVLKGNGGGGKGSLLPLLTHTDWHDKRKDMKHLKAPPPQGHANVFVLIFIYFFFFLLSSKNFMHYLSVCEHQWKQKAQPQNLFICFTTHHDKCCFHTHAVLSVQRGALFLVLFHIKWQICLFGNQHVCGVLRNKNSWQLLHSGLPLFPASCLQSQGGASRLKWHLHTQTRFAASSWEGKRGRKAHSGTPTQHETCAPPQFAPTLTHTHSLGVVLCASHTA